MGENNENTKVNFEPPKNLEGKYLIDKNNPLHIRWLRQQLANRGARAVNRGRKEFLDKTVERATPLVTSALIGSAVAAPIVTGLSLAGGYLGSKIGESVVPEKYSQEGSAIGGLLGSITLPGLKMLPGLITQDAYTTLGGKFGYYGNPFERVYHTIARNKNWLISPRHPELLRKINTSVNITPEGKIQLSNPNPRADFARTNFTTDRPVVSHSAGNWDSNDLLIVDPKVVKGLKPESIEPSDMFFVNQNITAKPNLVTLVTGNKARLIASLSQGMPTLSSPRLRQLKQQMDDIYYKGLREIKSLPKLLRKLAKTDYDKIVPRKLREDYAREILRVLSLRGTPTIEDYMYIDKLYGLDSGTIGIDQLNPQIIKLIFKPGMILRYPNGRELDSDYFYPQVNTEKEILEKMPYNKVFYDPASTIESDWAISKGLK